MTAKAENTFRRSVHGYFDSLLIHSEKMNNPYSSGTADDWYSGKKQGPTHATCDLWVEWKFIVVPVRDDTVIDLVGGKNPTLSALQQHWLEERYKEGRNVWVGVGSAKGGVFFHALSWRNAFRASDFRRWMVPRKELAEQIVSFVQGRNA